MRHKKLNKKSVTRLLIEIQDHGNALANMLATQAVRDYGLLREHLKQTRHSGSPAAPRQRKKTVSKKSNKPEMGELQRPAFLPATAKALRRIGWRHGCGPAWTKFANDLETELLVVRMALRACRRDLAVLRVSQQVLFEPKRMIRFDVKRGRFRSSSNSNKEKGAG